MGHLPQRMVLPGVFLVVATGPALDPGEAEAGFEAGAVASELRLSTLWTPRGREDRVHLFTESFFLLH